VESICEISGDLQAGCRARDNWEPVAAICAASAVPAGVAVLLRGADLEEPDDALAISSLLFFLLFVPPEEASDGNAFSGEETAGS